MLSSAAWGAGFRRGQDPKSAQMAMAHQELLLWRRQTRVAARASISSDARSSHLSMGLMIVVSLAGDNVSKEPGEAF